jgi:hypothetical protein
MNSLWPALMFIAITTYYILVPSRVIIVLYLVAYNHIEPDDFTKVLLISLNICWLSGHYGTDFTPFIALFFWDIAILWLLISRRLRRQRYDVLLTGMVDLTFNLIAWVSERHFRL